MLMTLAVRLILMEIPTAFEVRYIIENPLPQFPWAKMPFHIVHFLGLKDSHLANDHQVGDRYSTKTSCFIILTGPEFSEECFSLMRRSYLFHHVPRWAVLTASL